MKRQQVHLSGPHFSGTVVAHGHYGRPVLVFASEGGSAHDFENNGMLAAVADLVEAGRVKFYCIDSGDAHTWSDSSVPTEERAWRHGGFESWVYEHVVGWMSQDSGGASEFLTLGCSMGAYHAANFALKRADLFPLPCACPATTTRPRGGRGARRASRPTSTTRWPTSPTSKAIT